MRVHRLTGKVYTLADIEARCQPDEQVIEGWFQQLHYVLLLNARWIRCEKAGMKTAHLQFYALSEGWNDFTETGYQSMHVNTETGMQFSDAEAKHYFESLLVQTGFTANKSVQLELFG